MEKLESVQYAAALAVTGTWRGTSRERLYNELGWEPLSLRRWSRWLILFYKFVNVLTPDYTRDPIPPLNETSYPYVLNVLYIRCSDMIVVCFQLPVMCFYHSELCSAHSVRWPMPTLLSFDYFVLCLQHGILCIRKCSMSSHRFVPCIGHLMR